jgi:hypothetical protein
MYIKQADSCLTNLGSLHRDFDIGASLTPSGGECRTDFKNGLGKIHGYSWRRDR